MLLAVFCQLIVDLEPGPALQFRLHNLRVYGPASSICAAAVALVDELHILVDIPCFGLLAPLALAVWLLPVLVDVLFDVPFGVPSLELSPLLDVLWPLPAVISFPYIAPLALLSHVAFAPLALLPCITFARPALYIISFFVLPALAVTVF